MDDIETSVVSLSVCNNTNTSHVTTTGHHANAARIEVNVLSDLSSLKVDLDGVIDLDSRIRVSDTIPLSVPNTMGIFYEID